jgi:hypothetical protein
MTDPASTPSKHSAHSRYYRDQASVIRARLPTLQDDEVFIELYQLAAHTSGWRRSRNRPACSGPSRIDLLRSRAARQLCRIVASHIARIIQS